MALTFLIDGVDHRPYLREGSLAIDKQLGVEVLTAQVVDAQHPGAGAVRPPLGGFVYTHDSGHLLFGGEIIERRASTIWDRYGVPSATFTTITARSLDTLADRIVVDAITFPAQGLNATVAVLHARYLAPLGVTNLTPPTGGPLLPALAFDHQTLSAIFHQLTEQSGYPWRINGDRQFGFQAPGALLGEAITPQTVLDDDVCHVDQSRAIRANRLFLQTGGTGTVTHHEGRTLTGTQTIYLLNVEPTEPPTVVTENGVDLPIGAGTWSYDADRKAVVRATPGTPGHTITVPYTVTFPAWVRVWEASVQAPSGDWMPAALVDGILEASEQTDLAQAAAWGRTELARRLAQPQVLTVRTRLKGYYPFLQVQVTQPESGVTGPYLIEAVRVEVADDDLVYYTLTCVEDDVLHTAWFDFFKRRAGSTVGGITVAGQTGSTAGTPGTPTTGGGVFTPLFAGGDNDRGLRSPTYRDIPNAVPLLLGGPGWPASLRLQSYVMVDTPGQSVRLQILQAGGGVLAGPTPPATHPSMGELTLTFPTPAVPTRVLVQYVAPGAVGEAFVGMTQIEAA